MPHPKYGKNELDHLEFWPRCMDAVPVFLRAISGLKNGLPRVMESLGLGFPKDAGRFVEIFTRFAEEGGTFGQLIDELVEAFPEKRGSDIRFADLY